MKQKLLSVLLVCALLLVGCSSTGDGNSDPEYPAAYYAKIEIYDGAGELVKTIEDVETLDSFDENLDFDEEDFFGSVDASGTPEYYIVTYKKPVAAINNGPEVVMQYILFEDSDYLISMISPDVIKNINIAQEFLTFGSEEPESVAYLRSLV